MLTMVPQYITFLLLKLSLTLSGNTRDPQSTLPSRIDILSKADKFHYRLSNDAEGIYVVLNEKLRCNVSSGGCES